MSLLLKRENLPKALEEVYVDFYWSQKKLWGLDLSITNLEISELDWILDYPVWYLDQYPVPKMILKNPTLDAGHWKRIEEADLSFPIHVIRWKGRLLILDGIHRLLKARLLGHISIKVKLVEERHVHDILPAKEDFESGFLKQVRNK